MKCQFITGQAGTGKTTWIKNQIAEARQKGIRNYATLTATTGIAAINLSGDKDTVTTINSELGYFDLESLKDAYASRSLHSKLKTVARKGRKLVCDEASMFEKQQLELIHSAMQDVNQLEEVQQKGGLDLILVGDFLQLPPVKGEFCFNADCWKEFEILKLTKIWRQDNPQFIEMLNAARSGDGDKTAEGLYSIPGITIQNSIRTNFDGTTIVAKNDQVDKINYVRLMELLQDEKTNRKFILKAFRWGKQRGEWKQIPEERIVCKNAYVMILSNDYPEFTYANGSCGYIVDGAEQQQSLQIKLKSNGCVVTIRKVVRKYFTRDVPEGCSEPQDDVSKKAFAEKWGEGSKCVVDTMYRSFLVQKTNEHRKDPCKPYFDFTEKKWVIGEISYTPVRLAYASTVHKSQGLTLDTCQIDFTDHFFGSPSMAYVSLSRVRTAEGLTVVGNKRVFADRTNISAEVLPWI